MVTEDFSKPLVFRTTMICLSNYARVCIFDGEEVKTENFLQNQTLNGNPKLHFVFGIDPIGTSKCE